METRYHPTVMRACRLTLCDLKRLAANPLTEIKKWANIGYSHHCRVCRALGKVQHCDPIDVDCRQCPLNALEAPGKTVGCIDLRGYRRLQDICRGAVAATAAEITDAANLMHATISSLLESL